MTLWRLTKTGKKEEWNLAGEEREGTAYLHSSKNISSEARQWFSEVNPTKVNFLIVYGIGLGYYYHAAEEWLHADPGHRLIFVEDDPEVWAQFQKRPETAAMRQDPQVEMHLVEKLSYESPVIQRLSQMALFDEIVITALASYKEKKAGEFSRLSRLFQFQRNFAEFQAAEQLTFGQFFFNSFYKNIINLDRFYEASALFGQFKGIPAIICGAGPSLNRNIDRLKTLSDKALIFAGGSAVNVLNAHGMNPHFGVGVDPFPAQFSRVIMNTAFETPYFVRPRMNHEAMEILHGPKIFVAGAPGYPVAAWVDQKLGIPESGLHDGYSVVNLSLSLAYALGCNPIICVGEDLAYTGGESYGKGIEVHPMHNSRETLVTKTTSEDLILETDIFGKPVYTLWKWVAEALWFADFHSNHADFHLVNATEGGIGFPGIPNIPLEQVEALFLKNTHDLQGKVHAAIQQGALGARMPHQDITTCFKELVASFARCLQMLKEIQKRFPDEWNLQKPAEKTCPEGLQDELAYREVLKTFDETYRHHLQGEFPGKKLQEMPGRWPFLAQVINVNLKTMYEAVSIAVEMPELRPLHETMQPIPHEGPSPSRFYSQDGQMLLSETFYQGGKKTGEVRTFYWSGAPCSIQRYHEGALEGVWETFYPEGIHKSEIPYTKGQLNGTVKIYYPNGTLKRLLNFKEGVREGVDQMWHPNGKPWIQTYFKEGKPFEVVQEFATNGQLIRETALDATGFPSQTHRWSEEGKSVNNKEAPRDFYDSVVAQTSLVSGGLRQITHALDETIKAIKMSANPEIVHAFGEMKQQIIYLEIMNHKLVQEAGLDPNHPKEAIWKSPEARKKIEEGIQVVAHEMSDVISQMNEFVKKMKEKFPPHAI